MNEHGFTKEEMKRIEDHVIDSVKEQYEWLKRRVEEDEEEVSWMKEKENLKKLPKESQELILKKYIEPKLKAYENNKKDLENFDFATTFAFIESKSTNLIVHSLWSENANCISLQSGSFFFW